MITLYDMNTGQIIETRQLHNASDDSLTTGDPLPCEMDALETRLSTHNSVNGEERRIPPELVVADLNAFLHMMS